MAQYRDRTSPASEVSSLPSVIFGPANLNGMANTRNTVADLPIPGNKGAPKIFRGQPEDLETFIGQFERLANSRGLSSEEKCTIIGEYCSRRVRETIKGLQSHKRGDWEALVKDILNIYDINAVTKRYAKTDLHTLCRRYYRETDRPLDSLKAWKLYIQDFVRIGGSLLTNGRISQEDYAIYFWLGIPKHLRNKLELAIRNKLPDHDMSTPFPIEYVEDAVENLLHRDRFDTSRIVWEIESENDFDDDLSTSGEESDMEEEFRPKLQRKLRLRNLHPQFKVKTQGKQASVPRDVTRRQSQTHPVREQGSLNRTRNNVQSKVESLIKEMGKLSISDPAYGLMYYQALKLDPDVASCLVSPLQRRSENQPRQQNQRTPGASFRPANDVADRPAPSQTATCFGCGRPGHRMMECRQIQELISQGIIIRNQAGRLRMASGQPIPRRSPDQPLTEAVAELQKFNESSKTHFAGLQLLQDYESDEDCETNALVAQYGTRSKGPAPKVTEERAGPLKKSQGAGPRRPAPVDVIPSRFDPTREDVIMEDDSAPVHPTSVKPSAERPNTGRPQYGSSANKENTPPFRPNSRENGARPQYGQSQNKEIVKPLPRQSAISEQAPPINVVNKLLNTPVTISVGEMIGSSKEVAAKLSELLKYRQQRASLEAVPAVTHLTRARKGELIVLPMKCQGVPVEFIVDTGSEINIVSEDIWHKIGMPLDKSNKGSMADANGGLGSLMGTIEGVPLSYGHIQMEGDFYVSANAPFQGLLGRPWQVDNEISIKERSDGTHLEFPPYDREGGSSEVLILPKHRRTRSIMDQDHVDMVMSAMLMTPRSLDPIPVSSPETQLDHSDLHFSDDDKMDISEDDPVVIDFKDTYQLLSPRSGPVPVIDKDLTIQVYCEDHFLLAQTSFESKEGLISRDLCKRLGITATVQEGSVSLHGQKLHVLGQANRPVHIQTRGKRTDGYYDFLVVEGSRILALGQDWLVAHGMTFDVRGRPDISKMYTSQPVTTFPNLAEGNVKRAPLEFRQIRQVLKLDDQLVDVVVDPLCHLDLVSQEACTQLGLAVNYFSQAKTVYSRSGEKAKTWGIVRNLRFEFGITQEASTSTDLLVIKDLKFPIILGRDWLIKNSLEEIPLNDLEVYLRLPLRSLRTIDYKLVLSAALPKTPVVTPKCPEGNSETSSLVSEFYDSDNEESDEEPETILEKENTEEIVLTPYQGEDFQTLGIPEHPRQQLGQAQLTVRIDGVEREVIVDPSSPINIVNRTLWSTWDRPIEDRKSTRLNSSHSGESRMPSSA